jgi:hypothetical protein
VDAVIAAGFIGFFFGVVIAPSFHFWGGWNGWGWGVGWHQHAVVVNNRFYVRNNYRLPNNYIRGGPSAWSHDPSHRGGVAYPSREVAGRVGAPAGRISPPAPRLGGEGMVITRPPREERRSAPAVRPGPAPGGPVPRAPLTPPVSPDRDRTLFGNSASSGDRARIESDRGHSSLGSRPVPRVGPPQSRPAPTPQGRSAPIPQNRPAPTPQGRPAPGRPPTHR